MLRGPVRIDRVGEVQAYNATYEFKGFQRALPVGHFVTIIHHLTGKYFSISILPPKYILMVRKAYMKSDRIAQPPITLSENQNPSIAIFWKLWTANGFSNLGDGLYQILLPLIAVQITS